MFYCVNHTLCAAMCVYSFNVINRCKTAEDKKQIRKGE